MRVLEAAADDFGHIIHERPQAVLKPTSLPTSSPDAIGRELRVEGRSRRCRRDVEHCF
jgi:hypothetical protein